jgi:two-component system, cell cycle sensor histidine kinase DivJ
LARSIQHCNGAASILLSVNLIGICQDQGKRVSNIDIKTSSVNLSTPIREFFDALVHPSAGEDPLTAERHVAFMAPRLYGSLLALGVFPVFLALHGAPSALEFFVLAWMIFPIATACFLSRTGRYDAAQALSALALTAIVTIVAANSGGMNSVAAVWLVLIPLEAALSGSRRAVAVAALLAVGGVGLLVAAGPWLALGSGVERSAAALPALGTMSALIYAAGIALSADALVRANFMRRGREAERQPPPPALGPTDVITHHGNGGRIVRASANAEAVLGAPASDLQNYGLFDRIHIADRPAYLRALSEAAASGDTCEIAFRLRREAKAEFTWIEMRCWSGDGNLHRSGDATGAEVIAVMRDVTLRKTRQDASLEARIEAERANAAKSRFLACMSHELRTPLNAIIGFSDLLRNSSENLIDSTRALEYARIINESGHHLLVVANEILDMSRLETGNFGLSPEPIRLDAVITSCAELLALRAQEAGVTFNIEVARGLPEIVADRHAVMQILINLVTNAIKFSDPGGTVAVSAGVDGEQVWLEVADTGIGIAPDDLARIGNPFFQVQGRNGRKRDGAGLGLSIVKGLVALHGGELKAASGPGEGTRMVVRLPLDCECAAASRGPVLIANGIREDIPNALSERPATSGHAADPSALQPGGMNSPASFPFPVQRRA